MKKKLTKSTKADRSAVGKRSKNKGNNAERAVAKLFQEWWSPTKEFTFQRTPSSGGWGQKAQFNTFGDIVCSDASFPFTIEIKCQEAWSLDQLLTSDKGPINKYWKQTVSETQEGKIPLLVMRQNHKEWLCIVPWENFPEQAVAEQRPKTFQAYIDNDYVLIMSLKTFMTAIPSTIKTYNNV